MKIEKQVKYLDEIIHQKISIGEKSRRYRLFGKTY